jgi:hypothetical protein
VAETRKAHGRRLAEGWFDRFCPADRPGSTSGAGRTPSTRPSASGTRLLGATGTPPGCWACPTDTFWTVYASHVLEHLADPVAGPCGTGIGPAARRPPVLSVPDMATYEGKPDLPSRWNDDHKTYWLPDGHGDRPHVRG